MTGPVRFLIPEGGVSAIDRPGPAVPRSRGRPRAVRDDRAALPRRRRPQAACACRCTSTTKPSPTRWSPPGARSRRARAAPQRATPERHAPHRPHRRCSSASAPRSPPAGRSIGGGAGTGLSAKCEEAGGIDLIVIYNSGRYRMAGRGSLAGLLAYGNANEIVCEMAHEVLPVVQAHAGARRRQRHRPVHDRRRVPAAPDRRSASPACRTSRPSGLIDGTFRANLEETGMGYGLEVELIARARALDLLTTPYVFSEADAQRDGRGRRRHRRLPPRPHDRRRDRRRHRADARRLRAAASNAARGRRQGGAAPT